MEDIQRQNINRARRTRMRAEERIATKTYEILNGDIEIPSLTNDIDSIGDMTFICHHCGAYKFQKETSSNCCLSGQIDLPKFPCPPQNLHDLWFGDSEEAKIFRKYSRILNNAVCLSSVLVGSIPITGFNPSIIYQGKVTQLLGSLRAEDGVTPTFAQLYVLDSNLETTTRYSNMMVPENTPENVKQILRNLLERVQQVIHQINPFVKDFIQILDIPEDQLQGGKVVISAGGHPQEGHQRVYNAQTNLQELRIVTNEEKHDLVIHRRSGGGFQKISDLNPKAMPLHFTLLFPAGTPGWDQYLKHRDNDNKRVTPREFFAYHLNKRNTDSDYIFQATRLFQEWILISWITCENQKLAYQQNNQTALRADTYQNVRDFVVQRQQGENEQAPPDSLYHNENENRVGRLILASSFVGSPRWYNSKFQDAMAIVRHRHKPDLFITMTCNPNWPEIKDGLRPGQTPQDRPDLVSRVFQLKHNQLMADINKGCIFGEVSAYLWVVEFQKRGLPHVHILLILKDQYRPNTSDSIDKIVCAELPPSPHEQGISEDEKARRKPLWDLVLTNMIHGPCGNMNPNCICMENGKCSKKFPKSFIRETLVDPDTSHPMYRRRSPQDGGGIFKKNQHNMNNGWVVPYNAYLLLRYECHINIEICVSTLAAKYLYKYVTKGPDRAMVRAEIDAPNAPPRNEIKDYEDMRSIGSSEASWKILRNLIAKSHPPVQTLRLHLENQQHVVFVGGGEEQVIDRGRETELTAFFLLNAQEKEAEGEHYDPSTKPKYVDMPGDYVFRNKEWHLRRKGECIGRIHTVNPLAGDVFYLRLLLHHDHCRGKTSFVDMRTVGDVVFDTFQAVCRELGLLCNDEEWSNALTHAAGTQMCPQIRALYVVILMFCTPSDPARLFNDFWYDWTDDFKHKAVRRGLQYTDGQLKTMVRLDIQTRLNSHEKDLTDFNLEPMTPEEKATVEGLCNIHEPIIREELDFDVPEIMMGIQTTYNKFTPEQRTIYDKVLTAVRQDVSLQLFISARGGCGKTFLLNAILDAVRCLLPGGCVALAMATTGIAANLLKLGRTFHSRMKAPTDIDSTGTLGIRAQTGLARLVAMSRIILIDEATMLHEFYLRALDRTLCDIMLPDLPFGGKVLVLAGDFRQCLPVVPGANRGQLVKACINQSPLWTHFEVLSLNQNMRVRAGGDNRLKDFDTWTLNIGNGTTNTQLVPIRQDMLFEIKHNTQMDNKNEERSMKEFSSIIFPDLELNINCEGWLDGRCILAPTNKEVDCINDILEASVPGAIKKFCSSDNLEDYRDAMRFNVEYLNSLTPSGFPRHILNLKPGMPVILLRNICSKEGLCNGTKLIFKRNLSNVLLVCSNTSNNKEVLIPRIKFICDDKRYPFHWSRRQFPLRLAFSTTINKSQGQTLKHVGVWLRKPVFSHGQLYVACSRTGNPSGLKVAIMDQGHGKNMTDNIVYHEVLLQQ